MCVWFFLYTYITYSHSLFNSPYYLNSSTSSFLYKPAKSHLRKDSIFFTPRLIFIQFELWSWYLWEVFLDLTSRLGSHCSSVTMTEPSDLLVIALIRWYYNDLCLCLSPWVDSALYQGRTTYYSWEGNRKVVQINISEQLKVIGCGKHCIMCLWRSLQFLQSMRFSFKVTLTL